MFWKHCILYLFSVNFGCGSAECTAFFSGKTRTSRRKGIQDICYIFHNFPVGSQDPGSLYFLQWMASAPLPETKVLSWVHYLNNRSPLVSKDYSIWWACSRLFWSLQSDGPGCMTFNTCLLMALGLSFFICKKAAMILHLKGMVVKNEPL